MSDDKRDSFFSRWERVIKGDVKTGFQCAACGRRFEQARLSCADGCDGAVYRAPIVEERIPEGLEKP